MLEYFILLFELESHRLIHVTSLSRPVVPVPQSNMVRVKLGISFHFVVNRKTKEIGRRKEEGVLGAEEVLKSLHEGLGGAMTHMLRPLC